MPFSLRTTNADLKASVDPAIDARGTTMSHHYTTKALGKIWLPPSSPSRIVSRGRYGTWPPSSTCLKHHSSPNNPPSLHIWWGRPVQRIAILLTLTISTILLFLHFSSTVSVPQVFHTHHPTVRHGGSSIPFLHHRINWRSYAYTTYATTLDDLCNSLMLAESLHRLRTKADVLVLHASHLAHNSTPSAGRLLAAATELYAAKTKAVVPVIASAAEGGTDPTWAASFTKLLAFNQTAYARVLSLDGDATLLQPMDELFLLPLSAPAAMPQAYWLSPGPDGAQLSSSVVLATPSSQTFALISAAVEERGARDYDMEIVNALFRNTSFVLPHRPYLLLTGEFRNRNHSAYFSGSTLRPDQGQRQEKKAEKKKKQGEESKEPWSARSILQEAKYIHFSDHPLPKPWHAASFASQKQYMPACKPRKEPEAEAASFDASGTASLDCEDRDVWLGLYEDFRARRRRVCGGEFVGWEGIGDGEEGEGRWEDGADSTGYTAA